MRCFIAVKPSDAVLENLSPVLSRLRAYNGLKTLDPKNIHLTIFFLGEVPVPDAVSERLNKIRFKPFDVEVSGIGCFPSVHRPRVIWAGVKGGGESLNLLHSRIYDLISDMGYAKNVGFHPHITLARVKDSSAGKNMASVVGDFADSEFGAFQAGEYLLFASTLSCSGPIYHVLSSFPFM
jgi:RNA 2',3'-cyclic 3'-phosphodiesterase